MAYEKTGHGLILGKFMPPHAGHVHLVQFALNFAERVTVLVCSLKTEPIPGRLRYQWMRELFPRANVVHITEELPQEPSEDVRFWEIWRRVALEAAGVPIDYIFASEDYGRRLAQEVGATFIPVDPLREQMCVSARAIRARPLDYWRFIPECVRPYYVKRVCIFGPESTGKSTLARDLAARFGTVHVAEFARTLLNLKDGVCDREDIPVIARGQAAAEDSLARQANKVLVCDTDVLTTTIWSEVFFGDCPDWVRRAADLRSYDLYLLMDIDAPWVDDRQRNLPHRRQEFFDRCRFALDSRRRPYAIVHGGWSQRFERACAEVERLLSG
jgi:NadR type nicotinamide-nucleotide adenylyltransferase